MHARISYPRVHTLDLARAATELDNGAGDVQAAGKLDDLCLKL
jgi:hypothetical protein